MQVIIFGRGGASREVASWIGGSDTRLVESGEDFPRNSKVIIPIGTPNVKKKIYEEIGQGYVYPNYISPSTIHCSPTMSFGNILCPGSIINVNVILGKFNLINNGVIIGHDTRIGDYSVINPHATISGGVTIGDCCLIGAGAVILQYLKIGDNVTVGAGAVVTKDVPSDTTVVGVPAKRVK